MLCDFKDLILFYFFEYLLGNVSNTAAVPPKIEATTLATEGRKRVLR